MTIANRLRGALAIYVALLVVALSWHASTVRRSAARARAMNSVAATHRVASTGLAARVDEMDASARKYGVTRDSEYVAHLRLIAAEYAEDLTRLRATARSLEERSALEGTARQFERVRAALPSLVDARGVLQRRESLQTLVAHLAELRAAQAVLAEAAQGAMTRELLAFDLEADRAQRQLWAIVIGALLLGAALSSLLTRAVAGPLARLTAGTRAVAAGDFAHRIETTGRDELTDFTRDFNGMAARLAEVEQLKRDFVSNVSHDLKTPLSSMQETTEVLLDEIAGSLNDRQRRLLTLNLESGRRLSGMLNKLLDLSRLESGAGRDVAILDLGALVRRAAEHVNAARAVREDRPLVSVEVADGPLLVRASAEEIAQLIDNLLENAVKFSPDGGAIRMSLAPDASGDRAVLRVADQGSGVADADKARIFERFHQAERGRPGGAHGVGLGLAICRRIAERHEGTITVHDNSPRGSVFEVCLPGLLNVGGSRSAAEELSEAWL